MNTKQTARYEELKKIVNQKHSSSWFANSDEFGEFCKLEKLMKAEAAQSHKNDWHNDPATEAQYNYLAKLGVNMRGQKVTKLVASEIISSVKNGDGVGSFGLFFFDGSN